MSRPLLHVAILGLLASTSCQRPQPREHAAPPEPGVEAHDERSARTAHYALRVLDVVDCKSVGATAPADSTRRLGVELSLEPFGDVQVPANPYYARLVDEHQQVYEATLGACGAPLSPTLPRRGQQARGYVVFDVPRDARHFTLLYMPQLVGAPTEEVSIALGP